MNPNREDAVGQTLGRYKLLEKPGAGGRGVVYVAEQTEPVGRIKITDYCDQEKISTKARVDLFIKVCHAVQHAHQNGIIHRDIKPSNILVTLHDGVPNSSARRRLARTSPDLSPS